MKLTLAILCSAFLALAINFRHDVDMKKYEEKGNEVQFESVGKLIETSDSSFKSSCVLVSPSHILMAAHSLENTITKPDTVEQQGHTMVVYRVVDRYFMEPSDLEVEYGGQKYSIKEFAIHPNYRDSVMNVDLALLKLEKPVDGISPAVINHEDSVLSGKVGWGAGWGVIEAGDRSLTKPSNTKRLAGSNMIDTAYDYEFWIDFDHPLTDTCCNELGSPDALEMEFSPNGGDSGSGMFMEENGKWYLVGILSTSKHKVNMENIKRGIYHSYGSMHQYVNIYQTSDWIKKNMVE